MTSTFIKSFIISKIKMSLLRVVFNHCKTFPLKGNVILNRELVYRSLINVNQERHMRKAFAAFLKTMKVRRKIAGPDKVRKRSDWLDWNYNAELYAFNKRLQENISDDTLRCIFVHDSFIKMEEQKRKNMEIQGVPLDLKSNSALVACGQEVISKFLKRYLRHCFTLVPEDGISAVYKYLTSDDLMSHISSNIGTKDLIYSEEYPPEKRTLATTLKAVIGGIATSDSVARAETFVLDFLCPQLIGKDIFEIWDLDQPIEVLNSILIKQGRELSESRLIFESGRNTIEAVYHVGLYSEKQFLGKGVGETLAFAEEMAGFDALRKLFQLNDNKKPLPFGVAAKSIEFKSDKEHVTIRELCDNSPQVNKALST